MIIEVPKEITKKIRDIIITNAKVNHQIIKKIEREAIAMMIEETVTSIDNREIKEEIKTINIEISTTENQVEVNKRNTQAVKMKKPDNKIHTEDAIHMKEKEVIKVNNEIIEEVDKIQEILKESKREKVNKDMKENTEKILLLNHIGVRVDKKREIQKKTEDTEKKVTAHNIDTKIVDYL